jgi:transglutaminase-like putative cysteine protease
MSIKVKGFISVLSIILLLVIVYIYKHQSKEIQAMWDTKRTLRYTFQLENKTNKPITNVVFKTYAPIKLTSTQQVIKIDSSMPFNQVDTKYGNTVLEFDIEFIPPFGKKIIQVTSELLLSDVLAESESQFDFYLLPQPQIESDHQFIKNIAAKFNSNQENVSEAVFKWVVENVEYTGYGQKDRGATYAAQYLQGDCTEFAYLNTAINRAIGRPSRAVNGYFVEHDTKLNAFDFHTWSEVWQDNTWINIDPQKNSYKNNQSNYIAMNVVTDQLNQDKEFKRFWVSNPELIVTMK